ncbi:neural-cadherin-like protein [Lates japonicus]|uniref:Neural-cadherin-like protein n=1 Tax=Lates japonicus TaxID=270547 RepID=A0AAD3MQE2_LATJO|nr:neural-cadherin-like protein [Lates japonicus]GLD58011.1 neural-cadherin-like protein [Lates japonicus]
MEIQTFVSSLTIIVIPIFVSLTSSLLPRSDSLQLQSLLRVNVSQVQVDECVHTDCKTSGGCSTQLSISDSPTLVDSGAFSLVSVKVTSSAVCGCAAREMTHRPCSSYPTNPCLNGGTCIDTQDGYRWAACLQLFRKTGVEKKIENRHRSAVQSSL